jgi:hypothetical protein
MNNVILQPCGSKAALKHYKDTVRNSVALTTILPFLAAEHAEALQAIYPSGECAIWGLTPGEKKVNVTKWNRIKEGDVTIFSANKKLFASAVVTYKVRSYDLARHLWGLVGADQTWEYIYFLDEVRLIDIPYATFNPVVDYVPHNIIMGFTILNEDKSQKFFEAFGLWSETYVEPITQSAYEALQDEAQQGKLNLLEKTDAKGWVKRRLEQHHLKQYLFGRRTLATCGICEQEYPIAFLVAAHIKRRAACSETERKDRNVVMPMCKFGCDELFENGYIAVQAGQIVDMSKKPITSSIRVKVAEVTNRGCTYATPERSGYFQWHLNDHSK